jgi:hypothetical protein
MILHRERVDKVFGSNHRDCSLALSSSSPRLVYLFVGLTRRVIAFNVNFVRPIVIVKEPQVTYGSCSQIMSYIFNILICVGMILLNNLMQCFLFITMIHLSKTCDTAINLICYALVMFMIYS